MKKIFSFLLAVVLFASLAAGQAVKFNLSESPRITLAAIDCIAVAFSLIFFGYLIIKKQFISFIKSIWSYLPWRILLLFLLWALVSLTLNINSYTNSQFINAFSYWFRLVIIAFVPTFIFYQFKNKQLKSESFLENFHLWGFVLLIFGYLQLILLPDFSFMAYFGWDPHQGRMLSTFFDPNYLGAFLVLLSTVTLGFGLWTQNKKLKVFLITFFILSWAALYFTYSRSAWAQGAIALPLVAYRKDWKVSLLILAIFIGMVFMPNRLGSRIAQSGSIFQSQNPTAKQDSNYDPSAAARGESLKRGLKLASNHWLVGVGYNAYGIALYKDGLSGDNKLTGMSSQGSDSSLINVFATTGIVGLLLFLSFFGSLAQEFYYKNKVEKDWLAWSLFSFLVAWIAGSFFNNTLFYILILLPFLVLTSISLASYKNK